MGLYKIMGMGLFMFEREEWKKLYYYNCTIHHMEGSSNIPIGLTYSLIGIICEIMYVPFMIAMWKREFMQYSCYQFMFLLGIIDMLTLSCNAIISGFQEMFGIHFCTHPQFFYVVGCVSTAGWFGTTMTCVLLAINRFFEMIFPKLGGKLFSPNTMTFWLVIPIGYWVYIFMVMTPCFYNVSYHGFYYDPYYGTSDLEGNTVMLFQAMCICLEICFVAIVYVYNQFFPVPEFVVVIEQITWVCVHGDTPFVYLVFNKTLSREAVTLIKSLFAKRKPEIVNLSSFVTAPSNKEVEEIKFSAI